MPALCKCMVIIIAIQSKTITKTVQNILQNNLKGTACSKKYAETITWHTEAQQAPTDGHIDLNLTFLSNTNTI